MFSFIITTSVKNEIQYRQLVRCICSIRKFHSNTIHLINDNSNNNFNHLIYRLQFIYNDVIIYNSIKEGYGESLVPKYILDILEDESTHYIYLHDSMLLNKKLENIENIENIQFLLHFTHHRQHYDIDIYNDIENEFYKKNNIKSMSNLILSIVNNYFKDQSFIEFVNKAENNKDLYVGCFGISYIVNKHFFKEFSNKFKYCNENIKFEDIMIDNDCYNKYIKRNIRCSYECIFSLLLHYYYPELNYEKSLDGLYYDGITVNPNAYKRLNEDNDCIYLWKGEYISKFTFNR